MATPKANYSPQDLAEMLKRNLTKNGVDLTLQHELLKTIQGLDSGSTVKPPNALDLLLTADGRFKQLKDKIDLLASKPLNVLIVGETGTGKELIARALHGLSGRKGSFIGVNCAGIPSELFESEFFGVTKGAYTGCTNTREGYFQQAQDGTILLDEISEIPYPIQCKLLRVIEQREIRKLGDTKNEAINCRIISATNCLDLNKQTTRFRQDLYYRLKGSLLLTIPLKDRRDDIRLIASHYDPEGIVPVEIIELWVNDSEEFKFEGNVRELKNMVEEYIALNPRKIA